MALGDRIQMPMEVKDQFAEGQAFIDIFRRGLTPDGKPSPSSTLEPRTLERLAYLFDDVDAADEMMFMRLKNASIRKDSPKGLSMIAEAETLKEQGNEILTKDLSGAIHLYYLALEKALDVADNRIQLSILYSNLSYAMTQAGQFLLAGKFAYYCMNIRPEWYKSGLRMIELAMREIRFPEAVAFSACLCEYPHLPSDKERSKIFAYFLKSASFVAGGHILIKKTRAPIAMWRAALANLCHAGDVAILTLLLGVRRSQSSIPPIVPSNAAADVTLWRVFESCSTNDWHYWGENLVVALIRGGASWESVSKDGKLPLHATVKHASKRDSTVLLTQVVSKIPKHKIQERDENGNNALHIASSQDFNKRADVIQLLQNLGVNQKCKNNDGKTPKDLVNQKYENKDGKAQKDCASQKYESKDGKAQKDCANQKCKSKDGKTLKDLTNQKCESKDGKPPKDLVNQKSKSKDRKTLKDLANQKCKSKDGKTPEGLVNKGKTSDQGTDKSVCVDAKTSATPKKPLATWTTADVQTWLVDNGLKAMKDRFKDVNGRHLAELRTVQDESPKFFKETVKKQMSLTFSQVLTFSELMRKLPA